MEVERDPDLDALPRDRLRSLLRHEPGQYHMLSRGKFLVIYQIPRLYLPFFWGGGVKGLYYILCFVCLGSVVLRELCRDPFLHAGGAAGALVRGLRPTHLRRRILRLQEGLQIIDSYYSQFRMNIK